MTDGPIPFAPQRIAEEGGVAGALLRQSEQVFQANLSESGAWRVLDGRRKQRSTFTRVAAVTALAASFGAVVLGMKWHSSRDTLALSAEARAIVTAEPPVAPAPSASAPSAELDRTDPHTAPILVPVRREEPPTEATCSRWSTSGQNDRALECFRSRSRGSGVEAEVALYQAARLSADTLRDPRRALSLLDEHRTRFPAGAMRGEVEWLRIRSLKQAGRLDEALEASEALLATPTGRTLASELHLLRGRIYQEERNDCATATREFVALVGEAGPLGDEAELRRAECLQKLGRKDDAIVAYRQYLRRAQPSDSTKARDRLRSLGGEP